MNKRMDRRQFLENTLATGAVTAAMLDSSRGEARKSDIKGKGQIAATADTCIFVWLAGGMCHVDTFDPKIKGNGEDLPGSYFNSIKTTVEGVELCEHLPGLAQRMDRLAILRTLHHNFPNHTQGVDFMHTGRVPTGTVVYPSVGSIVAHELGGFDPKAPAYVVVGHPMQPRGPGFLGGKYNYIHVTDTEAGPAGLQVPRGVSSEEYQLRVESLKQFSAEYLEENQHAFVEDYLKSMEQGWEMMSPKFQSAFAVKNEAAELREAYGEEFGQRLLLSRRLVQHGIRFVECSFNLHFINGYGWDTHAFAQKRVHLLIRQLDRGLAALVDDLEKQKMLDRTLVVVATEFGRPPEFDGQGGRGHHSSAFCALLFGGGIKGGQAIGRTDELGREIVERPISIPDFHATVHRALGINPEKALMTPGGRPVPITDFGEPLEELFA